MAELWPFGGLPAGWEAYFALALCVIIAMFAWSLLLFVRGQRAMRRAPEASPGGVDAFSWVFLVPALNEELTIRDSVERLLALELAERRVLVIDDGSDDRTAEIIAEIDHPDLTTIHRREPDARLGKAAALDHAYRRLEGTEEGRERVIVAIVDADGRLHPEAPAYAATHFADPEVGGVQSLVRIYNRHRFLTWMQDVEFSVYGYLFQAGRNGWGTAGMGGNGQFNRLSALDEVSDARGPWRDRLTEDQDLGLRLIESGWKGRQELRGTVDQQGLSSPRALFRQRTRWSQGNLQAMALARGLLHTRSLGIGPRIELLAYLLMPFWQGIIGVALIAAVVFALTGAAPFWAGGPTWMLVAFYLFAFGGTVLGAIASRTREGLRGWVVGFLIGHAYAIYTWTIWPVLIRSTLRQIVSRDGWAKTEREPLGGEGEISVA